MSKFIFIYYIWSFSITKVKFWSATLSHFRLHKFFFTAYKIKRGMFVVGMRIVTNISSSANQQKEEEKKTQNLTFLAPVWPLIFPTLFVLLTIGLHKVDYLTYLAKKWIVIFSEINSKIFSHIIKPKFSSVQTFISQQPNISKHPCIS